MKTSLVFVAVAIAATSFTTGAMALTSTEEFVKKAAIANKFEIESSKIAVDKARNGEVKAFAQQMIDDHTATGNKMKQALADSKTGLQAPTALDDEHKRKIDKLRDTKAEDFDRTYINMQEDAHEDAVKLFDHYADSGDNATLKKFAADTLPALKAHLEHVEKLD